MRTIAGVAVAGALLVSLTACSTPSADAACTPDEASKLVTATGEFGANPEVEFPTPLVAETTGVSTLIEGDGDPVPAGGSVVGTVSIYIGESGEALISGGPLVGVPILFPTKDFLFPFTDSLQCGSVGSRIVTTGSAADILSSTAAEEDYQLDPEQTLVVVTDIQSAYLGRANGADQLAQSGMPAIALAPSGQPGFTFPDGPAPTEFRTDVLKRGSGAEVEADDAVVLHFSAMEWGAETLLNSTWVGNNGIPVIVPLEGQDTGQSLLTAQVREAMVGQTVGSQVLIASPGDQTLVYVIDVLGIAE